MKKIDHIVITTSDIDACMQFYTLLGFTPLSADGRHELFAGDFKINVHIKGRELLPHAKYVQTGSADLCFEITENIDDFKSSLLEKGLEVELGVVDRNGVRGKMRSIYLRDPDGTLIEFCSYEQGLA